MSVTCEHCQKLGMAGSQINPYVFELKGPRVWLHNLPCMPLAFSNLHPAKHHDSLRRGSHPLVTK